jgi:hypothetical protein
MRRVLLVNWRAWIIYTKTQRAWSIKKPGVSQTPGFWISSCSLYALFIETNPKSSIQNRQFLEPFQLAQVRQAMRLRDDALQERQAHPANGLVLGHHQYLVEEYGDRTYERFQIIH